MSKHTAGPWAVDTDTQERFCSKTGQRLESQRTHRVMAGDKWVSCTFNDDEANAQRIVACVNACEGIGDPAAFRRQYDEMLEALLAVRAAADGGPCDGVDDLVERAIAEAEGRAQS